jgi:hypothetical protein
MSETIRKSLKALREGITPVAPEAPSLKTGDTALRKPLAQSPNTTLNNADDGLPISVVRNLIYSGAPQDLAQLRQIVDGLSPRAKANLMASIARETRDPQSPAKAISLTPEGQMLVDAVFNKKDPDPSWITSKPATPGGGKRLDLVSAEADLEPKTFRPDKQSEEGRTLKDTPSFRSNEEIVENKDGSFRIKHTDQHLDGQTKRSIERAKEGLPVGPIYDDAANTPGNRKPGRALSAGTQTPQQEATKLMHRMAETSNAHGVIDSKRADDPLMYDAADVQQDNPSVFAPGNTGSKMKRHVTSVRPADHSDALRAFSFVKKGEFTHPNQQFNSAEDFARAFVESVDQEGLNVTPVTARERADATEMLQSYNYDDDFITERTSPGLGNQGMYMPPPGEMTDAAAGRMMRQNMSDTVRSTKTAERALMQEQAVSSLARKFQDIFGHEGWGADYKPSARPGTSDPIERGPASSGVATTQDPASVPDRNVHAIGTANRRGTPDVDGRSYDEKLTSYEQEKDAALRRIKQGDPDTGTGYFDESQPLIRTPQKPQAPLASGKPGMEIGEDVDADDLLDLHQQRVGGDGEPISTEEVDPNFARGRDLGDRTGVNSKPAKELPGHKRDAYNSVVVDAEGNRKVKPDGDRPFAAYNRENRVVSESDLQQRRMFQKAGGETERSSVLRQQLRALMESNEPEAPGTRAAAAKATQIADLQRRLRLAERLDSMSGINSMRTNDPETGSVNPTAGAMIPTRQPTEVADLQANKLAASATPIDADEILPPRNRDLDLNNEPIDVEFEVKKPAPTPEPAWKKWAKRAGVVGGGILGYEFLRQGGEPPINGGPPQGGGGQMDPMFPPGGGPDGPGGYVPYGPPGGPMGQDLGAKPEDRIRALQNFQMQVNPHTQILQSYNR